MDKRETFPHIYAQGGTFNAERELACSKRRQQLRQNSVEIRELEATLRQAYINQELASQRSQKLLQEARRLEEMKDESRQVELERQRAVEAELELERRAELEKICFKQKLDQQILEKQQKMDENYREFLAEKKIIDEVIAEVKAEEHKLVVEAMVRKQVEQETIRDFVEAQKMFVVKEAERVMKENEEIEAFLRSKEIWSEEQRKIERERRLIKNEGTLRLGQRLEMERVVAHEKDELLYQLHEGRHREVDRILERQEIEKDIRKRLDLRRANEVAAAYRRKQQEKVELEEERWKQKIMEEAEKEARLEQMSDTKRRMKKLEMRRDMDKLLEERRKAKALEMEEEKLFWAQHRQGEKVKAQMIEAERMQILKQHAKKLIGFLPMRMLSEEDIEELGREDIKLLYQPKQKDALLQLEESLRNK